jgi:HSP20 family protein
MSKDWLPTLLSGRGDPFAALRRQLDDILDDLGRPGRTSISAPFANMFDPKVDVTETETELTVTAELPGMTEQDVEVSMVGDLLTIRGEKSHEEIRGEPQKKTEEAKGSEGQKPRPVYHRVERSWGAFERTIRIPFEFEGDKVKADFKNGVLRVAVEKPPTTRNQPRKIEIRSGA